MKVTEFHYPPGIDLTMIQTDKFKSAALSASFLVPLKRETAAANALVPYVLRRGTERYPTMGEISVRLEELYGGTLDPAVRKRGETQCVGLIGSFLDDAYALESGSNLQEAAALLEEMLLHPVTENGAFKEEYVSGEREKLVQAIRAQINDKRQYAMLRLLQEMCRDEHCGVDPLGGEADMAAVTAQDAWNAYQGLLKHARLHLFYCGTADAEEVKKALEGLMKGVHALQGEDVQALTCDVYYDPQRNETVVERMDVAQGKLAIGFRTDGVRLTGDDRRSYAALTVMNALYGGTATSKLFMNVRERLSLCYYASSAVESLKGMLVVSSGVEFDSMDRAQQEILDQLEAVKRGDFTDDELESARQAVVNVYKSAIDSRAQLESQYLTAAVSGVRVALPELAAEAEQVTREQVAAVAQRVKLDTVYRLVGKEG
jgi:predicted Zn-dependent peptidase